MEPTQQQRAVWLMPAGVVASGAAGYALYRLMQWWHERERAAVGYLEGRPFVLNVIGIDWKPVAVRTAHAFLAMRDAAARDGVRLKVVSGFRTMAEQQQLYNCYTTGRCNGGRFAAQPGHSAHQSGSALDLNTSDPGVLSWLRDHALEHGFAATVPGEPWHWELE